MSIDNKSNQVSEGVRSSLIKLCKLARSSNVLSLGSSQLWSTSEIPIPHVTWLDIKDEDFNDFTDYIGYDFISILHPAYKIEDAEVSAWCFLKNIYSIVEEGTYLCIIDVFLPCEPDDTDFEAELTRLWDLRYRDEKNSLFWNSLSGLGEQQVLEAAEKRNYESSHYEPLITSGKICQEAESIGWHVIINKPCNVLGEKIILLRK